MGVDVIHRQQVAEIASERADGGIVVVTPLLHNEGMDKRVERLIADIDEIVAADPATLGRRDTIVELHRQLDRVRAFVGSVDAAYDEDSLPVLPGVE